MNTKPIVRRTVLSGFVALSIFSASGCGLGFFDPEFSQPIVRRGVQPLRIKGSSTLYPLCRAASVEYYRETRKIVFCEGGGSSFGTKYALSGHLGMVSRKLNSKELSQGLQSWFLGMDGVAIVVSSFNPIEKITLKQIHDIFSGKVSNWKQLGGSDLPIVPMGLNEDHGTHAAFLGMVGLDESEGEGAADRLSGRFLGFSSPSETAYRLAQEKGAIAFLSLKSATDLIGGAKTGGKILSVDGVLPEAANVEDSSYPLVRPLGIVSLNSPQGDAIDFIDFLRSQKGRRLIVAQGFVLPPNSKNLMKEAQNAK